MPSISPRRVQINNRDPRLDAAGNILDLHDGSLEYFAGRFYWYGTAYGDNDGFGPTNTFRVSSSPDLQHWTVPVDLIPGRGPDYCYRPYVRHCPATNLYVLWFNWYPVLWEGHYGVAVSEQPEGPFRIVNPNVPLRRARPGDLGLMVDDDGAGYLIYTSIAEGHAVSIERLAPDFCSLTGVGSDVLFKGDESPTLFRRGDTYYALCDSTCCFCPQGSGAKVFTASSPLGPYTLRGNINRRNTPCGSVPIINAQQAHVARFPSSKGPIYIWSGDRWGSRLDGIKGHDFQFWSEPLQFDADGMIATLRWASEWSFDLPE